MPQKKSTKTANIPEKFSIEDDNGIWEGEQIEASSETRLEDDTGTGREIVLRTFEFAINPESFKQHTPTKQELFDSHVRGIRGMLWADGLETFEEVEPRLIFSKNKKFYRICLACVPTRGNTVLEKPQTLSEITNESSRNSNKVSGVI